MSETISINWGPILREIDSVANAVSSVDKHLLTVRNEVYENMSVLKTDLEKLKGDFVRMMEENRRAAALQRALTEIIRVRQELERDFGNYKLVRSTMIGILEATDLQLIRQTTITKCTEELMLSTPKYWLAPVLIALSSWIADNKALAIRALKEALRRDDEKTSLTFALICRRNGRTETCFKWLSRYFSMQKANDMKESIIAYIDAYTNGVFGVDRDNLCEEYIDNWMNQLQEENENFAQKQINYWKQIYQGFCKDTTAQYPKLAECAKSDFTRMNDYLMRINAAPDIISFFNAILSTPVDQRILSAAIDNELIKLVKNYDTDEAPLREEEEFLTDIKKSNGDEEFAKRKRALRKASRADHKVDLAERLSETIVSNRQEDISAKKTAIRFMSNYIEVAFKDFVQEKAPDYPQEITISTCGWSGKTSDGKNQKELNTSLETSVNNRRNSELGQVKNSGIITMFVLMGVLAVGAIVGFVLENFLWLGIVCSIGTVLFLIIGIVFINKNKKKRIAINSRYDQMLLIGKSDIDTCIKQYNVINYIVNQFDVEENCQKLLSEGK